MKPPARVVVGDHTYRVVVDTRRCEQADVTYGATFPSRTEIVVSPAQASSQLRDTVLHELLHAICDDVGLSDYRDAPKDSVLSQEVEERVVRALTPAVLALLRRNPRLVTYLLAADA